MLVNVGFSECETATGQVFSSSMGFYTNIADNPVKSTTSDRTCYLDNSWFGFYANSAKISELGVGTYPITDNEADPDAFLVSSGIYLPLP